MKVLLITPPMTQLNTPYPATAYLTGFCIHSAYWHRFAATIHSPVGLNPEEYGIELIANKNVLFAENDVDYIDSVQTDHDFLGQGLKKALYNYMHNIGFEYPVSFWFDKPVAETCITEDYIAGCLY